MGELNLKQIVDKLNSEFTSDSRKLVFWNDDKADFVEDIQSIELDNAKILFLSKDNQFKTKIFLEREDKTTNYLIYAPFSKPSVRENHLEDTLLYSKRFYADRASLLCAELGIKEDDKIVIEKYIKFFANKERTKRFIDLEIDNYTKESIVVGLLCALCKSRICSFEEVLRIVLTDSNLEENKFFDEFMKYDLLPSFWKLCDRYFGYKDNNQSLKKLLVTMFVTYLDKSIGCNLPKAWSPFISIKQGNIIAFMDNLMNNILYREKFDEIASFIASELNAYDVLSKFAPDDLLYCDIFNQIDVIVLDWIVSRLVAEDIGASLCDMSIIEICEMRSKMHFGKVFADRYEMLKNAFKIISIANYRPENAFKSLVDKYVSEDYLIDREYRKFIYNFDKVGLLDEFETIKKLVENIYSNEFLAKIIPAWNVCMKDNDSILSLPLQKNFYDRYIDNAKEKTVVIISDAMRYEVASELMERIQDDPRCSVKRPEIMLSTLPSYTRLGMAALLPNHSIDVTDDYSVLVDGQKCDNLVARQAILNNYCKNASCYQFDDIKGYNTTKLRKLFTGQQVVYIYHNQIDARGDKKNTEDEVFDACESAISEIIEFITRKVASANVYRFVITADHGFIYKRDKVSESDKIGGLNSKNAFINRRFIISNEAISEDGVENIGLGYLLGNNDKKVVSYPTSSNVFKVSGGGQNYVHGGSSPQEMLVPVIDIKLERGKQETKTVRIALVSIVQKITNLITSMDFIQSEPVSDVIKQTTYRIYFIDENDDKISNENTYVADSRELDSSKRIFRMRFNFKDMKYDNSKHYYLKVVDVSNDVELFRHQVMIDIAFADDFGW